MRIDDVNLCAAPQALRHACRGGRWAVPALALLAVALCQLPGRALLADGGVPTSQSRPAGTQPTATKPATTKPASTQTATGQSEVRPGGSIEQMRVTMDEWIKMQQTIAKERKDWQQGKEILVGRIDLIKKEIASLEEKIKEAESGVAEANKKREALVAENNQLKATAAQLTQTITGMEGEVRRLFKMLPEPIQTKLQPLYQRIPEDPAKTRAAAAERFQNVLGILNEAGKANNEISVNYEVHTLSGGKAAEVQAIYVGLGQAFYVSAGGEAGTGHPTPDGWKWEPSNGIARDLLTVLEIIQGKQTATFVPLPVKIQ
jgi:FtsZ-binding cell division protein ZapB